MATVRSPNRDYTLNTPGNRIQMTSSVAPSLTTPDGVPIIPLAFDVDPAPKLNALVAESGQKSYPIGG